MTYLWIHEARGLAFLLSCGRNDKPGFRFQDSMSWAISQTELGSALMLPFFSINVLDIFAPLCITPSHHTHLEILSSFETWQSWSLTRLLECDLLEDCKAHEAFYICARNAMSTPHPPFLPAESPFWNEKDSKCPYRQSPWPSCTE